MDLIGAKVIVLILLALVKLSSGLAPLLLVRLLKKDGMKWMENFMAGLMCFGGGVLLATVFIHMLPEVRESLETRFHQTNKFQFFNKLSRFVFIKIYNCFPKCTSFAEKMIVYQLDGIKTVESIVAETLQTILDTLLENW